MSASIGTTLGSVMDWDREEGQYKLSLDTSKEDFKFSANVKKVSEKLSF